VEAPLVYFTHVVGGRTYGAWYRRLSPTELEVFAIGLMARVECPEGQEPATIRATLEEFVRRQLSGAASPLPPSPSSEE
jgi:hypothetical protein